MVVECKSHLDSTGVVFRDGRFERENRYKLFADKLLRKIVLGRMVKQLRKSKACAPSPRVTLCLAVGKIAQKSDRASLELHFKANGWRLFDAEWARERLRSAAKAGYENDVAFVVSKLLLRDRVKGQRDS